MDKAKLDETIENHAKWLRNETGGERANLGGAYLGGAYLGGAYLEGANLVRANLGGAYLEGANLEGANLVRANLGGAYLEGANLVRANLGGAYLEGANLVRANLGGAYLGGAYLGGAYLGGAYLEGAYLEGAYLGGANLEGANLGGANLGGANLGGAKGLVNPDEWLSELDQDDKGWIVYKSFGEHHKPEPSWKVLAGAIIETPCDLDRGRGCACGVNFGTREWVRRCSQEVWVCRIRFEWRRWVVVPYMTDGKARTARLELIRMLKNDPERRAGESGR